MWRYEKEQLDLNQQLFSFESDDFRTRVLRVISNPNYELLINVLALANVSTMYIKSLNMGTNV